MFQTLLICFREGLEALLVVAIATLYLRKTGRLLVADEDYLGFGLTGEIAAIVAENLDTVQLKAPVKRVAVPNVPIPYSRPLERFVIPQVGSLVAAVREVMTASVRQPLEV